MPSADGHINAVNGHAKSSARSRRLFTIDAAKSVATLRRLHRIGAEKGAYSLCAYVQKNIPVYDLSSFSPYNSDQVATLSEEWHAILHTGPGVYVLKDFYSNECLPTIDRSNEVFNHIIAEEEASSNQKGDHFAASNANSRIWNSLQKHAQSDPSSFIHYYCNPWLKHVSESWLGPDYTVTAQVNIVRPGGKPQMPHRDYHLGFQTTEQCARWPKTMHSVSQFLTLQGAVAHSDMPLESGPTRFLPFSQMLEEGYMVWRTDEVKQYFAENWVSLPLEKGDAVFFNPALIHAAGENLTKPGPDGIHRSANLLQISSAFGKTMEKVNHEAMVIACWDLLRHFVFTNELSELEAECVVRAMTDAYPFPTNLDNRPPAPGGMAPESMTDLVMRCLREDRSRSFITKELHTFKEECNA